jgi:hypothetical protein
MEGWKDQKVVLLGRMPPEEDAAYANKHCSFRLSAKDIAWHDT